MGLSGFPEGKTKEGELGGTFDSDGGYQIKNVKVLYLDHEGGKLSVRFEIEDYKFVDGKMKPGRSYDVGPLTIENGGGIVLGVSGEKKEEQYETAIHKLPILRGIAKRQREELRRYKLIDVVRFRVKAKNWKEEGLIQSVSPRPKLVKGRRKVELRFIDFHSVEDPDRAPEGLKKAAQRISDWQTSLAGRPPLSGASPATQGEFSFLKTAKGADGYRVPSFTLGKEFSCRVGHRATGIEGEPLELGLSAKVKVTERADGKLSVEITPVMGQFAAWTGEERIRASRTGKIPEPKLVWARGLKQTFTVENGGGILLGKIRDEVSVIEDKVPLLGDVPVLGRLFSSTVENHHNGFGAVQITVTDH